MSSRRVSAVVLLAALQMCSCAPPPAATNGDGGRSTTQPGQRASDASREFPLNGMKRSEVQVKDATIRVWVARTREEHAEGFMHVPASEIADDEGMIFVFGEERYRSFWMKNTPTPLDIAFARADGTIVTIHQMPPFTLESFPSTEPAMFALEMKQGSFARLGIAVGDALLIGEDVFR